MSLLCGSPYDGYNRATLRVGLSLVAAVVFFFEVWSVAGMLQDAHFHVSSSVPSAPWMAWSLALVVLGGLALVALDRWVILAGSAVLLAMLGISLWQISLFGSPSRNSFFPGAVLFGWIAGQAWARILGGAGAAGPEGRAFRERFAEAGAMGCLAAAYVGSACSKLIASGVGWVNHHQLRWLILAQEPIASWHWLLAYRNTILESPTFASFLAFLTLVVEGGGFFFLLGPRLRFLWGLAILGLHLHILLLCTMPYFEPVALVLIFTIPWPALLRRPPVVDSFSERHPGLLRVDIPDPVWILLSAIIVLGWLLPRGWTAQ